jgi:hypothetical protein
MNESLCHHFLNVVVSDSLLILAHIAWTLDYELSQHLFARIGELLNVS